MPVRFQTERGCKCGPFRGGGLQPDPAAVPQREVVAALLSREGQAEERGHLFPPDFWGHPHWSVSTTNYQLLRLGVGGVTSRLCACPVTHRCVSIHLKARYAGSWMVVYSAGRCLSCCHHLQIKTQRVPVRAHVISTRGGRGARHRLRPGSYQLLAASPGKY